MVIYSEHEVERVVAMKHGDYIKKRKVTESIEDCVGEAGRKKIRAAMGGRTVFQMDSSKKRTNLLQLLQETRL